MMGYSKNIWHSGGVFIFLFCFNLGQAFVPEAELFPYDTEGPHLAFFWDDEVISYDFTVPFQFFNNTYNTTFISGNGQISFGQGTGAYTPSCTPSNIPMIMSYWADSVRANVYYHESTNRTLLKKAGRDIFISFPELKGISLSWAFIVTWKEVPFYGASGCGSSKRNTYQLVLATDGTHSFAIMYYSKIEWTTGRASSGNCQGLGGTPAKAGFDYGDGKTLYTIEGSCSNSILNIIHTSNIKQPGKWVFRIDSNLQTASCDEFDETKQKLRITPSTISYMGNVPLRLEGPCIKENFTSIVCMYKDLRTGVVKLEGLPTSDRKAVICPTPYFNGIGRTNVKVKITYPSNSWTDPPPNPFVNRHEELYKGHLFVMPKEIKGDELKIKFNRTNDDNTLLLSLKWDPEFFQRELNHLDMIGVENQGKDGSTRPLREEPLDLHMDSYDGQKWKDRGIIKGSIDNSGTFETTIDRKLVEDILNHPENPEPLSWSLARSPTNHEVSTRGGSKNWSKLVGNSIDAAFALAKVLSLFIKPVNYAVKGIKYGSKISCALWKFLSGPPPTDTRSCPPDAALAMADNNFEDKNIAFNPDAHYAVRQRVPSNSGAGSQCAYDKDGRLILEPGKGGTIERYSPNYSPGWHFLYDTLPYIVCCVTSGKRANNLKCREQYNKLRPSRNSSDYARPRPVRAIGDPHITTFDGLVYTFNGISEFWMVRMSDHEANLTFSMQARMEQYITNEGRATDASVFTAAAMEEVRNGERVAIQVSYFEDRISVALDGELVELEDIQEGFTIPHGSAHVSISPAADQVSVVFSSSFAFQFSTVGLNEVALNIIGMADTTLNNKTDGLMGNFDGVPENDFTLPNGTILASNSTMRDVHYEFGMQWIVSEEDSIFTYLPGKSHSDYSRPDFVPKFVSDIDIQSLPQNILDTCGEDMECVFDFVATGSESIANGTKTTTIEYERVAEVTSKVVKLCPVKNFLELENGHATVTNMEVGGTIDYSCDEGFTLAQGPESCNCTEQNGDLDPAWTCSNDAPHPPTCVQIVDDSALICEPPSAPRNGFVVGGNYTLGAVVELQCNQSYKIFWKNCLYNGEVVGMGICQEFCNVTYTCMKETVALGNGASEFVAVWRGYAGDIERVTCLSDFLGRIATFLRATSMRIHASTELPTDDLIIKKPYLLGC